MHIRHASSGDAAPPDCSPRLRAQLGTRTPRDGTAEATADRDLARYYRLLPDALRTIKLRRQEGIML
jgi:hypothetical protein